MEPLPDIAVQVKGHTYRAQVLAELEARPPGYDKQAWAAESQRWGKDGARMGFMPAAPKHLPPALIAKAREVHAT